MPTIALKHRLKPCLAECRFFRACDGATARLVSRPQFVHPSGVRGAMGTRGPPTRGAYDLGSIQETSYPAMADLTPAVLARNQDTVENIRLWDERPLPPRSSRPWHFMSCCDINALVIARVAAVQRQTSGSEDRNGNSDAIQARVIVAVTKSELVTALSNREKPCPRSRFKTINRLTKIGWRLSAIPYVLEQSLIFPTF